ncbi:hypothetical protein CRG98_029613 [Punica granatum]|uniref:Uncharacterized protein n=1 Tax=Punica granatum TaxID=22663 RepID=A0A2I0J1A0_PUNGR|nr:hypothetical protein CRG98_029613 [Punica granatum]
MREGELESDCGGGHGGTRLLGGSGRSTGDGVREGRVFVRRPVDQSQGMGVSQSALERTRGLIQMIPRESAGSRAMKAKSGQRRAAAEKRKVRKGQASCWLPCCRRDRRKKEKKKKKKKKRGKVNDGDGQASYFRVNMRRMRGERVTGQLVRMGLQRLQRRSEGLSEMGTTRFARVAGGKKKRVGSSGLMAAAIEKEENAERRRSRY